MVSFSRSCFFSKMYFKTNYMVPLKRNFSIELENAIICRVLIRIYWIIIALDTTANLKKSDFSFYINHQHLLLKHAEYYNLFISTLPGCIHSRSLSFSVFKAEAVLLIGGFYIENPPPILISSVMPWWSHQRMNVVWKELTPPLPFPNVYIVNTLPHQLPKKLQ